MLLKDRVEKLLWSDSALEAKRIVDEAHKERPDDPQIKEARERVYGWLDHISSPSLYRDFYSSHREKYTDMDQIEGMHERIPRLGQIRRWMIDSPPKSILDLGCFDGFALLNLCKGMAASGVGVDIDLAAMAHAANCARNMRLDCVFVDSMLEDLELPGKFDAVLLMEVLEHVPDPKKALMIAEKHLAPGGRIYVTTPGSPVPHFDNEKEAREHLRCINEDQLFDLIGDRVVEGHATVKPFQNIDRILCYRKPTTLIVVNPVGGGWDARDDKSYGGSEEAVVGLAEELVAKGHLVAVSRNAPTKLQGAHELKGVQYLDHEKMKAIACDLLIVYKWPEFLDNDIKARRVFFWTTDPNDPNHLTPSRMEKVDKVVALTEWHREELIGLNPAISDDKFIAIPYGIPYELFDVPELFNTQVPLKRNPHTMVYASSLDRGLDILLDNWDTIRHHVPDATLHVWYGWGLFDKVTGAEAGFGEARKWKDMMIQKMAKPGIIIHERTAPDDRTPFVNTAIWAYPCTGGERFCLTGVKAQKLGAIPIIFRTMALRDTVKYGEWPTSEIIDQESISVYVTKLVNAMLGEQWQVEERSRMVSDPDVALTWERVYNGHWRPLWSEAFRIPAYDVPKKKRSQKQQTLSVCMITYNAEAMLIRCLRSVKDIADEIIVADAGSTDRTLEFLKDFGARMIETRSPFFCLVCEEIKESRHFSETDHEPFGFEGPRNDSIRDAQGDWILWIDSDEEFLRPENMEKYLRSNIFNGYALKQHHFSAVPPNAFKADMPVRAFRNGIGATFIGKVHEHPETGLNASITPCIVLSDVDIAHDGYLIEDGRRLKFQRNIGLMEADRRFHPERTLGKFLWLRDLIHLSRYGLEASRGRVTKEVTKYCEEAVSIYEKDFLGGDSMYAVDGMDYYSEACKVLNIGFEVIWGMNAAPMGPQVPGLRNARFSGIDAFVKALDGNARAIVTPFTGKYV